MKRTIVLFTNAGKLKTLNGMLNDAETRAKLTADNPIYLDGEDSVYALLDDNQMQGAAEMHTGFVSKTWNGQLHFVHHSTPSTPNHVGFREALLAKSHALEVGGGYAGLHERKGDKGEPYRWLARK